MNIEHGGKTYEVLPLDRISEITHAKLAGGKVTKSVHVHDGWIRVESPSELVIGAHEYLHDELNDLGIQPLRLVPKEPVTFEAYAVRPIGAGQVLIVCPFEADLKRFRCVEIVEEA